MGLSSSTQRHSEPDVEQNPTLAKQARTHFQEFRLNVPDEVTVDPFATKYVTFDHYEDICLSPNRNGDRFVCFVPRTTTGSPSLEDGEREGLKYLTHWKLVNELLFGITRRSNEVGLSIAMEHPRIMRYLGNFPNGFYTELILPGQQIWVKCPAIELPVTTPSSDDRIILRLYYRWALQTLSALTFMHSRGIFIDDFDPTSVYIRSDLSVAVTGFGVAYVKSPPTTPTSENKRGEHGNESLDNKYDECNDDEDVDDNDEKDDSDDDDDDPYVPYEPPTRRALEWTRPNWDRAIPGPRTDLFDWAKWVWRLMTNDGSTSRPPGPHEPLVSMDLETRPEWCKTSDDHSRWRKIRYESRRFQQLEDKRLGEVLYKAFTEEYVNAEIAMHALRAAINAQGVTIIGQDEIAPEEGSGRVWEDVFELVRSEEQPLVNYVRFKN